MSVHSAAAVTTSTPSGHTRCRLCQSQLFRNRERYGHTDDLARGICAECCDRPEAQRLTGAAAMAKPVAAETPAPRPIPAPAVPRAFSQAERALIRNLHAHMPAEQLLDILNTRLIADVGARAVPFTAAQLREEAQKHEITPDGDWGALRKLLAQARRSGLLQTITLQLVDDFSVVFRLSPAQHLRLRDVIKNAQEER
jgi:hypothetical protein